MSPAPRLWVVGLSLVAVFLGALLLARLIAMFGREPPLPPIVADTASVEQVGQGRPNVTPPTLGQRLATQPKPVARVVTRTLADSTAVTRWVELAREYARYRERVRADSLARAAGDTTRRDTMPLVAPPELLPPMEATYNGTRLDLWLPLTSGRQMRATAKLKPHWSVVTGRGGLSDSVPQMREDRAWVRAAREAADCSWRAALPAALLGALLDDRPLRGLAIGATAGEALCMAD